jgi:GTP cyclohydrolase I
MAGKQLAAMQCCVRTMLEVLGEDPSREGLKETPRVRPRGGFFVFSSV